MGCRASQAQPNLRLNLKIGNNAGLSAASIKIKCIYSDYAPRKHVSVLGSSSFTMVEVAVLAKLVELLELLACIRGLALKKADGAVRVLAIVVVGMLLAVLCDAGGVAIICLTSCGTASSKGERCA